MSDDKINDNQEDKVKKNPGELKTNKEERKSPSKEETSYLGDNTEVKFDIEGKFILVRVGSEDRPAGGEDIEEVENKLTKLLDDNKINCAVLVTHHAVAVDLIEPSSK